MSQPLSDPELVDQKFCCVSFMNPISEFQRLIERRLVEYIPNGYTLKPSNDIVTDHPILLLRHHLFEHFTAITNKFPNYPSFKIRGVFPNVQAARSHATYISTKMKKRGEEVGISMISAGLWTVFGGLRSDESHDANSDLNYTGYLYDRDGFEAAELFRKRKERDDKRYHDEDLLDAESAFASYDPNHDYLGDQVIQNIKGVYGLISWNMKNADQVAEYYRQVVRDCARSFLTNHSLDPIPFLESLDATAHEVPITVTGIMVWSMHETQDQAETQAKMIQQNHNQYNVIVCPIGRWLMYDPHETLLMEQSVSTTPVIQDISDTLLEHNKKTVAWKEEKQRQNFDTEIVTTDFTPTGVKLATAEMKFEFLDDADNVILERNAKANADSKPLAIVEF